MSEFKGRFDTYIRANFPIILLDTIEVDRAVEEVKAIVSGYNQKIDTYETENAFLKQNGFALYVWDGILGLSKYNFSTEQSVTIPDTIDLRQAYDFLFKKEAVPGMYLFKNAHMFWDTKLVGGGRIPYYCHMMSNFAKYATPYNKYIVQIGSMAEYPEEFKREAVYIEFELPTKEEVKKLIKDTADMYKVKLTNKKIDDIVNAASGMSLKEVEDASKVSLIETFGEEIDPNFIFKEKAKAVKKSGLLELIDTTKKLEDVGGLFTLKERLGRVAKIYQNLEEAKKFGLPIPKGYLLVGVPGSGKTLTALAVASYLGLPLYRCDVGALLGSLVGETERNTRELFRLMRATAPAVILFDELEKSMSGAESSSQSDAGVKLNLIGSFLTHMQDRDYPSFFVATANDVYALPAPLIRKGRWDDIFFVDLPTCSEREEIFNIHIRKSGRKPSSLDVKLMVENSNNLTGAEIENVIHESLQEAFYLGRELKNEDVITVLKNTKGIAITKSEDIKKIRDWAKDRAKTANEKVKDTTEKLKGKISGKIMQIRKGAN